jgi:hypothetical protein
VHIYPNKQLTWWEEVSETVNGPFRDGLNSLVILGAMES